jgi:hypothetical protein
MTCGWCGASMRDIGRGGYGSLRVAHCTQCDHEREYVPGAGGASDQLDVQAAWPCGRCGAWVGVGHVCADLARAVHDTWRELGAAAPLAMIEDNLPNAHHYAVPSPRTAPPVSVRLAAMRVAFHLEPVAVEHLSANLNRCDEAPR